MNIVYMGTSGFAVPALWALATDASNRYNVQLVLTRPDAASGRGKALLPSPIKICAEQLALSVITPSSLSPEHGDSNDLYARITALKPDFLVVAAYGMILPQQLLDVPRFGCVNIHASLLPRWRGAAPVQRAILAGDELSGVSIMRMEAGLDTGPTCSVATTFVGGKSAGELSVELAELGARLLLEALPGIADGSVVWQAQTQEGTCYADKIKKSELYLTPDVSAATNIRKVLASNSHAPARCVIGEKAVSILISPCLTGLTGVTNQTASSSHESLLCSELLVGSVFYRDNQLILSTVEGSFAVTSLKPDGKNAMNAAAFVAGFRELQKGSEATVTWRAIECS